MADDLGFADLGCYGSEIRTPHLDALAAKGLRFSQFYNTAKCHSSRVSLLTGLYCDQAGSGSLSRGATIAEVLSKAGYSTSMVGKWHLSKQPTDFGFQRYWGHLSGACNFFTGDNTFRFNGEKYNVPEQLNGRRFYTTHAMGDFALQFLDEVTAKEDPFLLYVAFNAPHYPLQAPEADVKKWDGAYDDGWDALRRTRYAKQLKLGIIPKKFKLSPRPAHIPAWKSLSAEERQWEADRMEVFAAMVEVMDAEIGRILAALRSSGLEEETLVIFSSDHGDGMGAHRWNQKSVLYEESVRVPLILSWPGRIEAGIVDDEHLASNGLDLYPTICDFAGVEPPRDLIGRSLRPLVDRAETEEWRHYVVAETLFGAHIGGLGTEGRMVRSARFKYVRYSWGRNREQLYDLAADPGEMVNLAVESRFRELLDEHRRLLSAWSEATGDVVI